MSKRCIRAWGFVFCTAVNATTWLSLSESKAKSKQAVAASVAKP